MDWKTWRLKAALFLALLFLVYFWAGPYANLFVAVRNPDHNDARGALDLFEELTGDELATERYFRLVDETGRTIAITGRRLRVGDRYLDSDNRLYAVSAVEGYLARARYLEQVEHDLKWDSFSGSGDGESALPVQGERAGSIAIYHSHNAESYVPSDGTDSIYGRGGIHDVGAAFAAALEQKGITVLYSERLHLPHDRGAYRRSRVTAQELLRQGPEAIFDVHRDAAPWEAYAREMEDGQWVTQLQIVVGLSNPGAATNRNFAYDLKGYADRLHPGLIRGVFMIWGAYNQDLSPLSLLVEVGAHTNTKEAAISGITRFADVVGYYFYGPETLQNDGRAGDPGAAAEDGRPPAFYRDAGGISSAISGTVVGLLLTSLGAALGFYFLNNPGALEKLFHWWENLPENASTRLRQARQAVSGFPAAARRAWFAYPGNLRRSWRQLNDEWRHLPRFMGAAAVWGRRAGIRLAAGLGLFFRKLPGNLKRAWLILRREVRVFPAWLGRLAARAARAMRRGAVRGSRTLRAARAGARDNLALAWARIAEDFRRWAGAIRAGIKLLRRRIGP